AVSMPSVTRTRWRLPAGCVCKSSTARRTACERFEPSPETSFDLTLRARRGYLVGPMRQAPKPPMEEVKGAQSPLN
ncbi:MAG TPA: hypothetical protein VK422_04140, partial [Pyrinomonadaceae bacterium]|nr:hypothetical protein [Pyrinomonadaceae bacterium]